MSRSRRKTFAPRTPLPPAGGVVTTITRSVAIPGLVSIKVGRKTAGRIDEAACRALAIQPGTLWTDDLRSKVERAMIISTAREYALRTAANRPMSRQMLVTKLRQRDLDQASARAIAEDLAARGVIDEAAFAEQVVGSTIHRKPAGARLLEAKLRSRGIDGTIAKHAINRAMADPEYNALAEALKLARQKLRVMPRKLDAAAIKRRLYAQLARRGFDAAICGKAVAKALAKTGEGDPGEDSADFG